MTENIYDTSTMLIRTHIVTDEIKSSETREYDFSKVFERGRNKRVDK